jgi:hypothetical protein
MLAWPGVLATAKEILIHHRIRLINLSICVFPVITSSVLVTEPRGRERTSTDARSA